MTWRNRRLSTLLFSIGLAFALLGQYYFAYRREYVWDGVFFWGVSACAFALLLRLHSSAQGKGRWPALWSALKNVPPLRVLACVGGIWLTLWAGWLAGRRPPEADFADLFWMWLIGVVWFLAAFAPLSPSPTPPHSYTSLLRQIALPVLLFTTALLVRVVDLEHIPANLSGDEGTWGVQGLAMFEGGRLANPFSTRWLGFPSISFLAWGILPLVFGRTVAALRALSAVLGAASVVTTFLLARELWGRRVGWLAAALLAFGHYHIHYSRLAVNNVSDTVIVTLALYLLVRGLRSRRAFDFVLAGAVMGLGWYSYFGARLTVILVGCYVAWRSLAEHRFLARQGRSLLLLTLSMLVVASPLLLHYARYPDELLGRSRQVSIFASGWLALAREATGRSTASLLLEQFWKSISAFNYTLDPTFWYHAAIPLLDFVSGVFFILGLIWSTARWRWPHNGLLLLWFWLALITGWTLTENPPSSQRMVIVAPAVAILVALGMDWLLGFVGRRYIRSLLFWTRNNTEEHGVLPNSYLHFLLLLVIAVLNLRYYFVIYTPTRVYGNPTAEVATDLARYLVRQKDGCSVQFYGAPYMYWDYGTLAYLTAGVEGVDVLPPEMLTDAPPPTYTPILPPPCVRSVFLPERLEELDALREQQPGGVEWPVYSHVDGRLLYLIYEVRNE